VMVHPGRGIRRTTSRADGVDPSNDAIVLMFCALAGTAQRRKRRPTQQLQARSFTDHPKLGR
jgi:hypothetical protein